MTLRLPKFTFLAPTSLAEATDALADHGMEAMLVAGGTDLYPNMKRRQFTPKTLVGLRRVKELQGVEAAGARLTIGASTTLSQLAAHPAVASRYPALATAAGLVSTPQLRNMGTIGGNICLDTRCNYYDQSPFWRKSLGYCMKLDGDICRVAPNSPTCLATFSSDTVPVLIGYDASVRLVSQRAERTVALRDLYQMDGMRWLKMEPGEILANVSIPEPLGLVATYQKLRVRGSFDFPIAGLFVGIRRASEGTVDQARLVLTGVYSMPVELTDAQNVLLGNRLEAYTIAAAADAAYGASRPVDNTASTIIQRRRTIRAFVQRALEAAAKGTTLDA